MKTVLSLLIASISLLCSAQITSYKIEQKVPERIILPYDSLSNINRNNIASLIGQQIQILPKVQGSDLETGPTLYTSKPTGYNYNKLVVKPDTRFTIYNSCFGAFENEIFDIVGVDSISDKSSFYRTTKFFLIVKNEHYLSKHYLYVGLTTDEVKNDVVLTDKLGSFYATDFIILGYFKKMREISIGGKLVNKYTDNHGFSITPIVYNLETGEPLNSIPKNHIWTIKDIALVENKGYKGLSYILTSKSIPNAFARFYKGNFTNYDEFTRSEAQKKNWGKSMLRKYGSINGRLIIQGKVKVGFTKNMCKESWGTPKDINKSTGSWGVHEQWIYGSQNYLYFENGKLTAIDN